MESFSGVEDLYVFLDRQAGSSSVAISSTILFREFYGKGSDTWIQSCFHAAKVFPKS